MVSKTMVGATFLRAAIMYSCHETFAKISVQDRRIPREQNGFHNHASI